MTLWPTLAADREAKGRTAWPAVQTRRRGGFGRRISEKETRKVFAGLLVLGIYLSQSLPMLRSPAQGIHNSSALGAQGGGGVL